jgi:hypothetical protein
MRRFSAITIVVALLLTLGLPLPSSGEHHGPVTERDLLQATEGLPLVAHVLGPAPIDCATIRPALVHSGRGMNAPIWVGAGAVRANSGWYMTNPHRLALGFGSRTKYGYRQKIFWQITKGSGPVTLRGWNVRAGQRIWFGRPLPQKNPQSLLPPPVIAWPSGILEAHRGPGSTLIRRGPTEIFVSSAGCYRIQARWKGGSLTIPFTAGG